MTKQEKKELLDRANKYDQAKEKVSDESLNNFRFLKADLSAWYNALTAVCFTVGAIAITVGTDKSVESDILYPHYFWWGTTLLLINGVLIFFLKKLEMESEFMSMPELAEAKADYWQMRNMTIEKANDDNSRANDLKRLEKQVTTDYVDTQQAWPWYKWVGRIIHAAVTDIVFGLLLFPVALMLTQIIGEFHITLSMYVHGVLVVLVLYAIYTIWGGYKGVASARRQQAADLRIRKEVLK